MYLYLSFEFKERCSHSDGAAGLFGVSDRRQDVCLEQSGPLLECSFQRLAQLFEEIKNDAH